MRRTLAAIALLCLCAPAALANHAYLSEVEVQGSSQRSIAVGTPQRGALIFGVQLPDQGTNFFTWDFPLGVAPSRPWRRWGTDTAIARTLAVLSEYRAANPLAPRVGIADISRRNGGPFGERFGGLGHASHQNGLDVDVLYPRRDHSEGIASKPGLIDRRLSQDLVNRFVLAGARFVFVGLRSKLGGPKKVVQRLVHHDDHLHLRWRR
ncbi:MAG: penicillin-insensitive murein endopeptidase [Actinomycetota bacterium]|nr:penicillin-insensitive murein endopeptidase [Actinomycetota bacterium]